MKCYVHNDREAVAQCNSCGKFLCKECADAYDPPLCPKCGKEIMTEQVQEARKAVKETKRSAKFWFRLGIVAMVIGALGIGLTFSRQGLGLFGIIFGAYIGLAFPMGLEKVLRSKVMGLIAVPIIGWIIILYAFAFFAAIFAVPEFIGLMKTIKEADEAKKDLDNVNL